MHLLDCASLPCPGPGAVANIGEFALNLSELGPSEAHLFGVLVQSGLKFSHLDLVRLLKIKDSLARVPLRGHSPIELGLRSTEADRGRSGVLGLPPLGLSAIACRARGPHCRVLRCQSLLAQPTNNSDLLHPCLPQVFSGGRRFPRLGSRRIVARGRARAASAVAAVAVRSGGLVLAAPDIGVRSISGRGPAPAPGAATNRLEAFIVDLHRALTTAATRRRSTVNALRRRLRGSRPRARARRARWASTCRGSRTCPGSNAGARHTIGRGAMVGSARRRGTRAGTAPAQHGPKATRSDRTRRKARRTAPSSLSAAAARRPGATALKAGAAAREVGLKATTSTAPVPRLWAPFPSRRTHR